MKTVINILLILLFTSIYVFAEEIEFKGSTPKVVAIGERFRLTYTLNAKGSDFKSPDLKYFTILSGPNISTSSSIQIINGQMKQSVTYTYTYILTAKKEGKFKIPPAKVNYKRKTYQSNSISIEVVKGSTASNQKSSTNQQSSTNIPSSEISNKDLFVRVNVNKRNIYQGEHIVAVIKVYTRLNLAGFEDMKLPSYSGFWTQDIPTPNQISLQRENVNGQIYDVGIIQKKLLFAQQSGEIIIDPFILDAVIRQKVRSSRSMFDDFFGGSYRNKNVKVKSKSVKINVKPLPANKSGNFAGAVGTFKMNASIDKNHVKANDPITLKIKISGKGNLKLIDSPKIDFPPDFEIYDPKISSNVKNSEAGAVGNKTFEYLIIPRHAGNYRISPINFSYFDIKNKQYKNISSTDFKITVDKADEETSAIIVTGFNKEDVKFIGSDIRFIKTDILRIKKKGEFFFGSDKFIMLYVTSFVLFLLIVFIRRNQVKRNSDITIVKNRKANRTSKKRLKTAKLYLNKNEKEKFYDEISKALWGYISDKLNISVSDLTKDSAKESLKNYSVNDEIIDKFVNVLDISEFARFAPATSDEQMQNIYKETMDVISKLENSIKIHRD